MLLRVGYTIKPACGMAVWSAKLSEGSITPQSTAIYTAVLLDDTLQIVHTQSMQ